MSINQRKNTILISEETIDSKNPKNQSLSSFFREKSEILQKELNNGVYTLYPQKAIAEKLNISVKQLQQKLYGQKPLTRDWLIAICAAYGLNAGATSDALSICNMPRLDDDVEREEFIVSFLESHVLQSVSIFEFNQALKAARLPLLEISYRKNKQNALINDPILSKYKEIRPRVVTTYAILLNYSNCFSSTLSIFPESPCASAPLYSL